MIKTTLSSLALSALLVLASLHSTAEADSAVQIDAEVNATLHRFFREIGSAPALADKAEAMLIFPSVIKAGIGIGGEYGEGALRIRRRTVGYYNTISASIGFQLGAQSRSVIIMFMTREALDGFRDRDGWEIGVDGSVALINIGAAKAIDTENIRNPIIGFIFGQKGLMYNLTLEGSKISRIRR